MQKNAVDFHVEHEHRETEVLLCVNCDSEAGYAAGMMNCHFFHAPINFGKYRSLKMIFKILFSCC